MAQHAAPAIVPPSEIELPLTITERRPGLRLACLGVDCRAVDQSRVYQEVELTRHKSWCFGLYKCKLAFCQKMEPL